jgi:hypothetical protein
MEGTPAKEISLSLTKKWKETICNLQSPYETEDEDVSAKIENLLLSPRKNKGPLPSSPSNALLTSLK